MDLKHSEGPPLTDTQEMLLEKHHDCECSIVERIMVRRLLKFNPQAHRYLDTLRSTHSLLKHAVPVENPGLWMRIIARIRSEEKTALMLGKRRFENESETRPAFWWKSTAVGVSALAAVFMLLPAQQHSGVGTSKSTVSTNAQFIPDVNLVGSNEPVRMVSRRIPNAVEVDWMRSDGRLRMMNEAEERAPIIWVKRRSQKNVILRQERGSSGVVMIDPRAPQGISISNK